MNPKKSGGGIILSQCNFIIRTISSAVVAFGSFQTTPEQKPVKPRPAIICFASDEYCEFDEEALSEEYCSDEENYYCEEYDEPEAQGIFYDGFDSSFKAYMDYRCITDTDSVQYQLQQQAYTDSRGFRRIGDDYCIALGTGFTGGCGERFAISLDSGYSFTAVVSDVKADIHTDATHCFVPKGENSGNVVEFIIDSDYADSDMLSCGDAGYYEELSGNVTAVERL